MKVKKQNGWGIFSGGALMLETRGNGINIQVIKKALMAGGVRLCEATLPFCWNCICRALHLWCWNRFSFYLPLFGWLRTIARMGGDCQDCLEPRDSPPLVVTRDSEVEEKKAPGGKKTDSLLSFDGFWWETIDEGGWHDATQPIKHSSDADGCSARRFLPAGSSHERMMHKSLLAESAWL